MTKKTFPFLSAWVFNLVASIALSSIYNMPVWRKVFTLFPMDSASHAFFSASLFCVMVLFYFIVLMLLTFIRMNKIAVIAVFVINAFVLYFMNTYSIVIDSVMMENVIQTDVNETFELLSWVFVLHGMIGLSVGYAVWKVKVIYPVVLKEYMRYIAMVVGSAFLISTIIVLQFQPISSMVRNNKDLRYALLPNNYIYATIKVIKSRLPENKKPIPIYDANKESAWNNKSKKTIFVLIVGETARADNFSLYGYKRKTNPLLEKREIITFYDMMSCGTSTAVSLPCMFASEGRKSFDGSSQDNPNNILHLINRSGFKTLWIDNNSGCKGVCQGIESISMKQKKNEKNVFDADMIPVMHDFISRNENEDSFIVMHQLGSHGPAYYKRTPASFRRFQPLCETERLERCTQEEVVNAYDNTILYADYFIDKTIRYLEGMQKKYNVALVYVSDHGESLGESNLYLHGMPYNIAPHEQKHVPFILWMSDGFRKDHRVDSSCLRSISKNEISHDNLFHSVLDVLDIKTVLYKKTFSVFSRCQSANE